jgi:hypothetical protein
MQFGTNKKLDVPRLKADLAAATVEPLSAHCATDRVRLQYSPEDIVAHGEPAALKKAIAFADALHNFFSQVDHHLKLAEKAKR